MAFIKYYDKMSTYTENMNNWSSITVPAVVWGRRPVLWDGQRSPGSYQVVTGVMRETAGLAQSAGGAHAEQR